MENSISLGILNIRFYKEQTGKWYVDLPTYPGPKADLQMVAGADTFLSKISGSLTKCVLTVSDKSFDGAEILKLVIGYNQEHGDYLLEVYKNEAINHKMWLCPVITYVFGRLPELIYFKS